MNNGLSTVATEGRVVIAELEVKPQQLEDFIALAQSFAVECQACEPGCLQFQVVCLDASPHRVLFFEIYRDPEAFEVHRASEHLKRFKVAFQGMVTGEQPLRLGILS